MPLVDTEVRRRCEEVLDRVNRPEPFSLTSFCRHVAERRGRALHLHPLPETVALAGACGVWLATDTDDHIFFEQRTTRVHQEHIVLHEIGHMLFDHHMLDEDGPLPAGLLPDLGAGLVNRLLARTNYTSLQEREAEMLATMIRAGRPPSGAERPQGVLGRLRAAVGLGA
ncbi:hypothetical protein [Streptomyces sp. UNOB3_S3]|uniref:hypothetical protein n=1 Tax=Streptomyces sp. UNOB3_S3 TaxID=2871682 RepID=UPI001E536128|nr:hypothetical protein [Streptomyces sp. UNOB3_S3]MCC3776392.1 hypothetical protein [Streptomyces sp. UNOB3_S3]